MTDRGPPLRTSNADARRRAHNAIDAGDRHLRDGFADRRKLSAALSAYRRAADIAPDIPDPLLRQAIVLVALDREEAAARAIGGIASIDPRLSDRVADEGMLALRKISGDRDHDADPDPTFAWLAERWNGRWHPETAGLAAMAPAGDR